MSDDVVLSAVDFLRLTEEVVVARVDLAEIGRYGTLYVKELTAAEKTDVLPRPKGKARMYKDGAMEIDWSQLSPDTTAKFLRKTLLVDDGTLSRYFADGNDTATVPANELQMMYDRMAIELEGKPHLAMEKLGQLPNAVANLLMKRIREISGLDDEDGEETDSAKKN